MIIIVSGKTCVEEKNWTEVRSLQSLVVLDHGGGSDLYHEQVGVVIVVL